MESAFDAIDASVNTNAGYPCEIDQGLQELMSRYDLGAWFVRDVDKLITFSKNNEKRCQRTLLAMKPSSCHAHESVMRTRLIEGFIKGIHAIVNKPTGIPSKRWTSKMLWYLLRECICERGHFFSTAYVRPFQPTFYQATVERVRETVAVDAKLDDTQLRSRLQWLIESVTSCEDSGVVKRKRSRSAADSNTPRTEPATPRRASFSPEPVQIFEDDPLDSLIHFTPPWQ